MDYNLKNTLRRARYQPQAVLAEQIWSNLKRRHQRITQLKIVTLALIGSISLIGLVPAFKALATDWSQSGFYEYLSLAFSSGGLIWSYWRDFLWLLAESLPALSIVWSLTLIFMFIVSLKYLTKQIINNQLSLSF